MSWDELRPMQKRRPKGWRGESHRHSLAARGIPTVARGVPFSTIRDQDDFQDFLVDERRDIGRRRIADARFQVSRDRRDLDRLRDIDSQIMQAMEDGEIDLVEILVDAKHSDRDLRAGGVIQKLREKIIPKKKVFEGVTESRIDTYSIWFKKELDRRNRKLAKAPSETMMTVVEADFNAKVIEKRQKLALSPADTAEVEAEARMYMSIYRPSEKTLVQRERAEIHPVRMVRTATEIPPERVARKFNDMSLERDYSEGEASTLDLMTSKRDLSIDTAGSSSIEVQRDLASTLAREHGIVEKEYREELARNRTLRSSIGRAMDEDWRIRGEEIDFREDMINNAERALVAGGIAIPAGLLSSLAMGIGGALGDSLGQAGSSPSSSGPQPSPISQPQPPPPAPTAPSEYLLIKKSDIIGTVSTPKGGT